MSKKVIDFSVLMAVYNKETPSFLKRSIESLLIQTLVPNEVVLVKDGILTEELDSVISDFEIQYPHIFTVVSLSHNRGLANALNEGMRVVRNPIVARMDSDDICIKNRFELQLDYLLKNNLDIVGGQII
jgi:glycosyltransferase involved in cell wall biosynthesis